MLQKFPSTALLSVSAPAVVKVPKSLIAATGFFEHVLRSAGAHALEPVLSVYQFAAALLAHVLVLAIVVCWQVNNTN